jgi:hypothetical protein
MTTLEQARELRRTAPRGVTRRGSARARLEIVFVAVALVVLALANGELASARDQAREERIRAAETQARIERISDEIQGVILELVTAGPASP